MIHEKFVDMVKKCTKEELQNLITNSLAKNRPDLAEFASTYLFENFNSRERGAISRTKNSFNYEDVKHKYVLHPSLSKEQIVFLANHNVPQENLYNATGMRTNVYKIEMKELGCDIAYGTTPCEKAKHSLRTRAGHCFQCDPKNISFLIRNDSPGEVYVAESSKGNGGKIIKVGCTLSAKSRIDGLNQEQYGGRSDWSIKFAASVSKMGMIESSVHKLLKAHAITNSFYFKNGVEIGSQELFSCNSETAINHLKQMLNFPS